MISDILSDALHAIEEYQQECPDVYGRPDIAREIEAVKATMRTLRDRLDAPPKLTRPRR